MPTITCSYKDLCTLVGEKFSDEELLSVLEYAKAEYEGRQGDSITIELNDTNQIYLWSVEGIARHLKASLGKVKGFPKLKLEKSNYIVNVDKSVNKVRPYCAFFVAKGAPISQYQLTQLIQLQEKIALSFGRKRKKVGVGLFPANKVNFPLRYKAVSPRAVSFIPLGMRSKMSLGEILEKHPKGKEFAWILKDSKKYPVVVGAKKEVLTFPPIINSEVYGKLKEGDDEIICEITGDDLQAVNLACNVFAYVLADRGFKIYPCKIKYESKSLMTPSVKPQKFKFDRKQVEALLGVKFSELQLKSLLQRAQYNYLGQGKVEIPPYRHDVMHTVDVAEDIAIMQGYKNVEPLPLKSYTPGSTLPITKLADTLRSLCVGFGFQEVWSAVLSSMNLMSNKMETPNAVFIELENYMSETFSCVRSWILPIMMVALSKNRHVDYPQKLFEEGLITKLEGDVAIDENHLAGVSAHTSASYTEAKQVVEAILRNQRLEYSIEEFDLGCFIPGRAAKVVVNGTIAGFLGEIHPTVLENFGLQTPVVGFELNLNKLKNN